MEKNNGGKMVNNNIAVLRYVRELREKIEEQRHKDATLKASVDHEGGFFAGDISYYCTGKLEIEKMIVDLLDKKEKELMEEEGL